MSAKQRIAQLEKQRPKARITWKDFIDWANGKVFDADTEARLEKEWGKLTANDVQKNFIAKDKNNEH